MLLIAAAFAALASFLVVDVAEAKTSRYGTSFVDADDDGVFDPGTDVLLSSFLGPDDYEFDTDVPMPGYTPPPGPDPVGLVLQGNVTLVDWRRMTASGTLRVRGSLKALRGSKDFAFGFDLQSPTHIEVADRAKITINTGGELLMYSGTKVTVGNRAKISMIDGLWLGADGPITLGEKVQIRSTGNKEDHQPYVWILGYEVFPGDGLYMRANDYADCLVEHNGTQSQNLVFRKARFRCGAIQLASYGHPDGNRLHVLDSYIDQRYVDGYVDFFVSPGPGGYLPDAILLTGTSVRARGDYTPPTP
jgi:hypothetical protein